MNVLPFLFHILMNKNIRSSLTPVHGLKIGANVKLIIKVTSPPTCRGGGSMTAGGQRG